MQHHTHKCATPSHGFKVGVATVASATLYERLLAQPMPRLDISAVCAAWPELSHGVVGTSSDVSLGDAPGDSTARKRREVLQGEARCLIFVLTRGWDASCSS